MRSDPKDAFIPAARHDCTSNIFLPQRLLAERRNAREAGVQQKDDKSGAGPLSLRAGTGTRQIVAGGETIPPSGPRINNLDRIGS